MMYRDLHGEKAFAASQYEREREYWVNKLSREPVKTSFPSDFIIPAPVEHKLDTVTFRFPAGLFKRLMEIINNSDSRLHMILVTGLTILLYKYTGHLDIIIGTPIDKQEVEGEFINTVLPIRNQIEERMTVKELLMQVKQTIIEASRHQNYPIETLPYDLNMTVNDGDFPLFDIGILLQNIQDKRYIRHINLHMIFSFLRTGQYLEGTVEYNAFIFERKTVERIIAHLLHLMQEAFSRVDLKLVDVPLLTEEEKKRLVVDFNDTTASYPGHKTIHQLFEEQVEKTPGNLAVQSKDGKLTYKELNEKANRLARFLREKGIQNNSVVGIILGDLDEVPLAIMAVLKAGGAYLPMGFEYPPERINYLLKDSQAKILLTRESLVKGMNLKCPVIYLEEETLYTGNHDNLPPLDNSESLAYIIYTSGTTGQPKGVMVQHRSLVNYIWWAARTYVKDEKTDFPLYSSISFDLTVTSLFTPLITGNAVIVYGGTDKKFYLEDVIDDNRVGAVKLTPSHLKLISRRDLKGSIVKRLIVGGEVLETGLAGEIYRNFGENIEIYNEYGPTETVVGSMIYKYKPGDDTYSVPIGAPIANTQVYLLDRHRQPLPAGIAGEIYISGDGLAPGYLHNPQLTGEKFVPNPFIPGGKMYRTGDLGLRLPDGNIEFKGRIDHQVKIRGYRVEAGEIEAKITDFQKTVHRTPNEVGYGDAYTGVAVVDVADGKGERALCAYILDYPDFEVARLRAYLSEELPDYMIPTYFVKIDKIPLTQSGKMDRKALPEPEPGFIEEYVAPGNEIEEKLAKIWSELLGIEQGNVSVDANFFEVGGHSLKATFLVFDVHKTFNVKIPLKQVFQTPTIKGLAQYLQEAATEIFISMKPTEEKEYYPLSSAQKRLYILQQLNAEDISYNMPKILELEGKFSLEKFRHTFQNLIKRHESLRTAFVLVNREPFQEIHREIDFNIDYFDMTLKGKDEVRTRERKITGDFIRPFDLSKAPLLRVGVIKIEEERNILMIDMHHIISDGISQELFTHDFMSLYAGDTLPVLRLQYKDYAGWCSSRKERETVKPREEYWLNEFVGEIPVLNMPFDFERGPERSFKGSTFDFTLNKKETKALKEIASETDTTLYIVLLTAYYVLLSKITGQEDIVVGIPIAGRNYADLEHIIGMFVNMLALRNYPKEEMTIREFLHETREKTLEAFENQDYQFDDLVTQVVKKRDPGRNPLFNVAFSSSNMDVRPGKIQAGDMPKEKAGGLTLKQDRSEHIVSAFDMSFVVIENKEDVFFTVEYATALFKKSTIEQLTKHYIEILKQIIKNIDIKMMKISISHHLAAGKTVFSQEEYF